MEKQKVLKSLLVKEQQWQWKKRQSIPNVAGFYLRLNLHPEGSSQNKTCKGWREETMTRACGLILNFLPSFPAQIFVFWSEFVSDGSNMEGGACAIAVTSLMNNRQPRRCQWKCPLKNGLKSDFFRCLKRHSTLISYRQFYYFKPSCHPAAVKGQILIQPQCKAQD